MRTELLNAITASMLLGLGVFNGATALGHNNEAVIAKATAQALEDQGDPQATEWHARAGIAEYNRDNQLIIVGLNLGAAACSGAASGLGAMSRRRENEGESQPTT